MSVLVRSTWREFARQRWITLSIGVTMFLGVALFAASYDAFVNLETSYAATYDQLGFADLTAQGGDTAAVAAAARSDDGVAAVTVRRTVDLPFRIGGEHVLLGRLVELTDGGRPDVNRVAVLDGERPASDAADQAMAERHLAEHFGLEPGDTIELRSDDAWQTVELVASVASPEYIWPARSRQDVLTSADDFGVVFATTAAFDALDPTGAITEVAVLVASDADPAAAADRISRVAVDAGAVVQTRAEQPSNAALQEDVAGFGELSFMFPVLFLGAGGLATYVLLGRLVRSRRSEIATLRANGLSTRRVAGHYLGRGMLLSTIAGVLGLAAGLVAGRQVTSFYTAAVDVPDTVIGFHPGTVLVGVAMSIVAGALAAGPAAVVAARTPPGAALRGTVPPGRAGRSWIEAVVPPARRLPARWRMVLRGIGRSPRRSMSTVLGVVLSLVLVLASWGMLDTVQILLERQFDDVQRQDAVVVVDPGIDGVAAAIAGRPGVATVERSAQVAVTVVGRTGRYATELIGFEPATQMHGFGDVGAPTSGLVAGRSLAGLVGIGVGDTVTVTAGASTVSLAVEGFVDEPLGTYAYGPLDVVAPLAETAGRSTLLVRFDGTSTAEQMRQDITGTPGVVAYTDSRALYETAQGMMGLFRAFVGVMLVFGGLMSFALIVSTTSANAAERAVELSALRVNGASHADLGRLLGAENLLLTALAIGPGLLIGWGVSAFFMSSFSSDLFDFSLHLRATTLLWSGLAVLAVSVVAQWPANRVLAGLDVARVVRERAS